MVEKEGKIARNVIALVSRGPGGKFASFESPRDFEEVNSSQIGVLLRSSVGSYWSILSRGNT